MSAADEILKQRRAELAQKFLKRSHQDALKFRARLADLNVDQPLAGAADLKMFAHKITGTGATLGLDALSEVAREFEAALIPPAAGTAVTAQELEYLKKAAARLLLEIERLLGSAS